MIRGNGRKGDANLCGIMRNDYNILLRLLRLTRKLPRLSIPILSASMRYLAQRYTMPYKEVTGILTDIGTEELAHLEIICAIVHQTEQIEKSGFDKYYVDHTLALWPQAASGTP